MDTQLQDENPEEEFITIIKLLVNNDLAVLHQVLILDNEKEQIQKIRTLRDKITFYPQFYNAYTARILVKLPSTYIVNEIVYRFTDLYLYEIIKIS